MRSPTRSISDAEALGEAVEHAGVDADADLLHAIEDGRERQIDVAVDALDARLLRFFQQYRDECLNCGGSGGRRGRRLLVVARGDVGEGLRGVSGIERIGEQHGVFCRPAQGNTLPVKQMQG